MTVEFEDDEEAGAGQLEKCFSTPYWGLSLGKSGGKTQDRSPS